MSLPTCPECLLHWGSRPWYLWVEAFASVGIEHGKTSAQMRDDYFASYHKGHAQ